MKQPTKPIKPNPPQEPKEIIEQSKDLVYEYLSDGDTLKSFLDKIQGY